MRPASAHSGVIAILLFVFLFSSLLSLSGCSAQSNDVQNNISNTSNGSLSNDSLPVQVVNETPVPVVTNTCWTGPVPCPDGTNMTGTWCSSGYSNVKSCNNTILGDATGVPDTLAYLTKFKCYWDIRKAYGYGNYFDPTSACASKNGGWKEACDCADFIERYNSR